MSASDANSILSNLHLATCTYLNANFKPRYRKIFFLTYFFSDIIIYTNHIMI